jgi:hypothetical protein
MFSYLEWIPEKIRNHPFISGAILVMVSVGITWKVLDATSMGSMKVRTEALSAENAVLHEELRIAHGRYDAAQASREDTISKRAGELSAAYRKSMNSLEARYEHILQENAELKDTLSTLYSGERRQAAERKEARLNELSAALDQNSRQIAEAQQLLYQTSATAGYDRASCDREKQNFYSNVCEHASKEESQVKALQEKIGMLERQGRNLSDQIVALEGKA